MRVKNNYASRSLGLEEGPSHVVWPGDGSYHPAVETPTIIEKDDEGMPEMVPSIFISFSDILVRVAKNRDQWTALQLV